MSLFSRRYANTIWLFIPIFSICWGRPAPLSAQNLNIDTELRIEAPAPEIRPPQPTVRVEPAYKTITDTKHKDADDLAGELKGLTKAEEKRAVAEELLKESAHTQFLYSEGGQTKSIGPSTDVKQFDFKKIEFGRMNPALLSRLIIKAKGPGADQTKKQRRVRDPEHDKKVVTTPKPEVIATLATIYRYDSNVNSTKNASIADRYLSVVPGVKVKLPTSATAGFEFNLNSFSARYDEQTARDNDTLVASLGYAAALSSVQKNPASETRQQEAISITTVGRSRFKPGYAGPGSRFYTPSVGWSLSNIPLGERLCTGKTTVNCFVAGVSLTLQRNWSGSDGSAKNTGAELGGSLAWNLHGTDLVWKIKGSVLDSLFDQEGGDRNDVFFTALSQIEWKPSADLTLNGGVEYYRLDSNITAAEYQKYVLVPRVDALVKF